MFVDFRKSLLCIPSLIFAHGSTLTPGRPRWLGASSDLPPMWEIPPLSSGRPYPADLGFEDWTMLAKRCFFTFTSSFLTNLMPFFFPLYLPIVEAHSPFVQCVAWGPAPLTDAKNDEPERIVNVLATGGTDKVLLLWLYLRLTTNLDVLDFSWLRSGNPDFRRPSAY